MKRVVLCLVLAVVGLNVAQAQRDWRRGTWQKDIPEHFLTIDLGGNYVITSNFKEMNPFAINAQVGYQYKVRPFVKNRLGFAFGGYVGYSYYPSNDIVATSADIVQGSYKSFSYVPIMLNANLYYNMKTSYIFLGIDAGINLMLCERDFQGEYITYHMDTLGVKIPDVHDVTYFPVAKEDNPLTLSRVVPSAKVYLGYMKELNANLRLRFKAGVEYNMGYEFDYQAIMLDGSIQPMTGTIKTVDCIDPFVTVGIVFSL
ncbi:MAG: hypothetical protein LBO06_03330 [Bacteroidales bacterium]|nr:hypothetical protein [Bacteroidales bacterium]